MSDSKIKTSPLIHLAAFVIVIAGLKEAMSIVVPFLLSVFIAIICSPSLFWLQRRKLPTPLAVALVVLGFFSMGILLVTLLITSLNRFYQSLPSYMTALRRLQTEAVVWLNAQGLEISPQVALSYFDPGAAMSMLANMLSGIGGVLTNAFMILLTVIFILLEASSLPRKLAKAIENKNRRFPHLGIYADGIKRYLFIKTLTSFVTGVIVAGFLSFMGITNPFLWGLIVFFLNYIPNIGAIIAAVPAVAVGLIQLGLTEAIIIAIVYTIINVGLGIIEPRFMGKGLGLSTLVVFLSLVFWGWVLGPIGMLLSVPLTLVLKLTFEQNKETRWLGILLSSKGEEFEQEGHSLFQDL